MLLISQSIEGTNVACKSTVCWIVWRILICLLDSTNWEAFPAYCPIFREIIQTIRIKDACSHVIEVELCAIFCLECYAITN